MTGRTSGPGTVLRPDRGVAARCSLLGVAAIALAVWALLDSGGHGLAIALLAATVVITAPFVGQLVAPDAFAWRLDERGLDARGMVRRVRVDWDEVQLARVTRAAGDPALRVYVGGTGVRAGRTLRLPVGTSLDALHEALSEHLGTHEPGEQGSGQ